MIGKRDSVKMVISKVMNQANGIGKSKTEAKANSETFGANNHQISTQAHSLKSMDNLRSVATQYLNHVKENNPGRVASNINNETIKDFINHKLDNGLSGASANTYLSELSKLSDNLNQLGATEISREVISQDIRNDLKDMGHNLGALNKDRTNIDGQAMVNFMKENSPYGLEAELQKTAGLRVDDALNIAQKITINENGSLHIAGSKNGNDYNTIPLNEDLLNRVQEAINANYSVNYSEYRETLKESAEATGNEWNGTHSLRFDYANDQREEGKSLEQISISMGHERPEITERYLT